LRAVDTNVVVRLIVNDDPAQAAAAHRAMSAQPVFMPKTVVVELEWVLRSVYQRSPETIAAAIESLLATTDITIEDPAAVGRAVAWFKRGLDFADALHLASSAHADGFLTFDIDLRRRASMVGAKPPTAAP
jgi:predicted nucleic-acid-binding protein